MCEDPLQASAETSDLVFNQNSKVLSFLFCVCLLLNYLLFVRFDLIPKMFSLNCMILFKNNTFLVIHYSLFFLFLSSKAKNKEFDMK